MGTDLENELETEDKTDLQDDTSASGAVSDATTTGDAQGGQPSGWDKSRQELDIERANARKARAELDTMTEAYEQANTKLSELQQEISKLSQAKQVEQDKLDEMDPQYVDERVAKNIKILERQLADKADKLKVIEDKIAKYEQQQAEAETKRRNDEAKESVLTTVEDVLAEAGIQTPAQYRNEANKLADHLVDTGETAQPRTLAAAVKLMTKCYLQIKKDKDSKTTKTKSVSVDTGKAGAVSAQTGTKPSGIKPGRLADIKAQMLKNPSWKTG